MSAHVVALSFAWGLVVSVPFVLGARRAGARHRVRAMVVPASGRGPAASTHGTRRVPAPMAPLVRVVAGLRSRRARRRESAQLVRELPIAVDVLAVAVGAGCSPFLALEVAVEWGPANVGAELARVLRAQQLGSTLDTALRDAGARREPLRGLTETLRDAGRLGAAIRPALARLAHETRAELRRAAETRARTVPVRLLFPLVFLVLPAFGLLTVAPALLAGFAGP